MSTDETPESPAGRLVIGLLLALIGVWLLVKGDMPEAAFFAVVPFGGAIYQVIVAAIAAGNRSN